MNRILIDKKGINQIIIDKNEDYEIIYQDIDNSNLIINVLAAVHANIFIFSTNEKIKIKEIYNLYKNSYLNVNKFYHNHKTKEEVLINLEEINSHIDYHFSNIGKYQEDYNIIINHHARNTISNIYNKAIALDNCLMNFNIDSNLAKNIKSCYLNQETRIIIQGENNCTIKPNMYIEEQDVIARHSSVMGKFSEEEIFYLMSRGISYEECLKLLIKGTIFSNLQLNMDQRSLILNIINSYWR